MSRQKKGSNNRYKTIKRIRKEYIYINNKKNDISNKIVSDILNNNKTIVIQDEQIGEWRQDGLFGTKIQHSILGRIKNKLSMNDRVVILDKWFPTTKYCSKCGNKVELELKDRIFECPNCKTKEDRDIHAANNMIYFYVTWKKMSYFYLKNNKLDRSGADQTSIKGPVKIAYKKFVSNLAKQEDTTSLALC